MRFQKQVTQLVDARGVKPDDVLTMAQTAARLECSITSVQTMLDRGRFTVIVDTEAHARQGRRLLLRDEVETYASKRRARAK